MSLKLGDLVPDFVVDSSTGPIHFHKYIDNSWAILFSHPNDFTPVCTTELGAVGQLMPEFEKRGIKVLALSCDEAERHAAWIEDIESYSEGKGTVTYPILADPKREVAVKYGMLDPIEKDTVGMPVTARAVFVIDPDKKLKLSILYPASTGRNFTEILRVVDSLLLTANYGVATPVDWKHGDECMILPAIPNHAAVDLFPKGFRTVSLPSGKEYIRVTPQPDLP